MRKLNGVNHQQCTSSDQTLTYFQTIVDVFRVNIFDRELRYNALTLLKWHSQERMCHSNWMQFNRRLQLTHVAHIIHIRRCFCVCFRQNDKIACNIWRKRIEYQHSFNARAAHQFDFNFSWEYLCPSGSTCHSFWSESVAFSALAFAIFRFYFIYRFWLKTKQRRKNHKALNLRMAARVRFGSSERWTLGRVCVWPCEMQLLPKYLRKRVICTCLWPMCSHLM